MIGSLTTNGPTYTIYVEDLLKILLKPLMDILKSWGNRMQSLQTPLDISHFKVIGNASTQSYSHFFAFDTSNTKL